MIKGVKSVRERLEDMKHKSVAVPRPLDIPQINRRQARNRSF